MPEPVYPHLSKAPIAEAVIDLRITAPKPVDLKILEDAQSKIEAHYPGRKVKRLLQFKTKIQDADKVDSSLVDKVDEIEGFQFISTDQKQIVQFRKTGFTFSRLFPYTDWETIRSQSRQLWEYYSSLIGEFVVTRVALRYINRISIGATNEEFASTFKVKPPYPTIPGITIHSFVNNTTLVEEEGGIKANYIFAKETSKPGDPNQIIILDIDAYQLVSTNDDQEIFSLFEDLRRFKNELFFNSLTETAIDRYR